MQFGRRLLPHVLLAAIQPTIRLGLLRFGTVSWELDVIQHHGLDVAANLRIEPTVLAMPQATQIAFQAGYFDLIVIDWLRVAQQRAAGLDWSFVPFSNAVGAMIVPDGSSIRSMADLPGHTLGIAGTPLDKSWIILRKYAAQQFNLDLETAVIKAFGPPAEMSFLMKAGRLDALITFWPFVARAQAFGARVIISVEDAVRELGVKASVPYLGYTFSQQWADNNAALTRFLDVSRQARMILATSDAEWLRLRSLTGAATDAELMRLRDWYRGGIPQHWGTAERTAAQQMYALFGNPTIPPGTFWLVSW